MRTGVTESGPELDVPATAGHGDKAL